MRIPRSTFMVWLPVICLLAGCARVEPRPPLDASFFRNCVFVSIDFQQGEKPTPITQEQVPAAWTEMGFTAEDVNAANEFGWATALPNAVQVADACRDLGLPMIFVHWGYLFEDAMDLDPEVRRSMVKEHGTDYSRFSGHIGQAGSQPAQAFNIRPGEYVLAKAAQDAFGSCNIAFVLRNLEAKRIVFVGGHTNAGGCLGKTARSAQRLGYTTLCISDATFNARESTRAADIAETGYDYVVSTAEFLELARGAWAAGVQSTAP